VFTKDFQLVARHENEIGGTTNVADILEFASRKINKTIDNLIIEGWFTEDFTLAELKTLYARERIPQIRPENQKFNDQFKIPTFQEVIDLAKRKTKETGRFIGIYPETKHPSYFESQGFVFDELLTSILEKTV
jgi:glycerophosphoryl diester phosphodiesterase